MKPQARLKLRDVRDINRLLGECRELWADPAAWREHLLKGAMALVGGESASWVELETSADGMPQGLATTQVVMSESEERVFWSAVRAGARGEVRVPSHPPMLEEFARRGRAVGPRQRFLDDAIWYRSTWWHDYRKPAGYDQQVLTLRALDPGRLHVLTVDRAVGGAPFDTRSGRCLDLLHSELAVLRGSVLATEAHRSLHGLSPRLRQTLERLLEGDSERQTALRLGISQTTVHQYVGQLYRHFNVGSRGELLAYFVRRRPMAI